MIKPKLKVGDRVQILHMEDEMDIIPMGTWGTVERVSNVMDEDIYGVKWDNGKTLNILSTADVWDTEENRGKFKKKKITEKFINLLSLSLLFLVKPRGRPLRPLFVASLV